MTAGEDEVGRSSPWNHKAIRLPPWQPRHLSSLLSPDDNTGGTRASAAKLLQTMQNSIPIALLPVLARLLGKFFHKQMVLEISPPRCGKASDSSPKSLPGELQTPTARRLSHTLIPHHSCLVAVIFPGCKHRDDSVVSHIPFFFFIPYFFCMYFIMRLCSTWMKVKVVLIQGLSREDTAARENKG